MGSLHAWQDMGHSGVRAKPYRESGARHTGSSFRVTWDLPASAARKEKDQLLCLPLLSAKLQARWASLGFGGSVLGALEHDSDPPAGGGRCQGRASPGERMRDSGLDCGATVLLLRGSWDSASSRSSSGRRQASLQQDTAGESRADPQSPIRLAQRAAHCSKGRGGAGGMGVLWGLGRVRTWPPDAASGWESPPAGCHRPQNSDTHHDVASTIPEDMALLEAAGGKRATFCMIPSVQTVQKVQIHAGREQLLVALIRGEGRGTGGVSQGAHFSRR